MFWDLQVSEKFDGKNFQNSTGVTNSIWRNDYEWTDQDSQK